MAAAVAAIVDGLSDASLTAEQFARKMQDVNTLTSFFGRTLQPAAAAAYFDAITVKLRAMADTQRVVTSENETALKRAGLLGDAIAYTRQHQVEIEKEHVAQLEKAVELLTQEKSVAEAITAAQGRETTFRDTLDKAHPLNSQIDDVSEKISVLQNKLNRGSGDTLKYSPQDIDTMVRAVIGEAGGESSAGQLAVAAVALNRLANGNFGDSLDKILKAGAGSQFNTFKSDDPTGAQKLSADSYQYQKTLHDVVMPMLQGQYKDPTDGALNFYRPDQANPDWGPGLKNSKMIDHQRFGTAANAPDAVPGLTDDEAEGTLQAVQKLQDELRRLNDLKAGGSASSKAELENAQATAKGMDDQVEAAKRILAAKQEELATVQKTGGTPQSEDAAAKGVAAAQNTLRERQGEQQKAAEALKTAALQEGSRERLDATLAEFSREQAGHAEGSAKYLEIEKQKLDAVKAFQKQEAADATEVEKLRYDAALKGMAEQKALIQQSAKDRGISASEETAQLKAISDRQEAENRTHFDRLRSIDKQYGTDSVAEVRKTAQAAGEAEIKLADDRVKAARAANERILQDYKSTFEQIGSTVSSSIMGMLQHTTTLRGLFQNVAKQIVEMFIQARVRMLADWAAGEAQKLTTSTTFQSLQTAVATAGESARTAVAATGAAAGAAAKAPAIIGSIEASANEAYAGTYAFLSPVMGPLAAAPALAAEAIVMAKAALPSFAAGSWSLPSDMVAQVHAGEMIVPAGPAAMMRAAAGGAGGGGALMGDMHFNIDGSKSPQETMGHIADNIRGVARMLNEAWKLNPTTRPKF